MSIDGLVKNFAHESLVSLFDVGHGNRVGEFASVAARGVDDGFGLPLTAYQLNFAVIINGFKG